MYERYHIPASVRVLWGSALATLEPGHQDTFVNYDNDDRAPLLFISGTHDHLMPPSVQRSNAKHYKSKTVTEVVEFDGPHLLPSRDGWEEVADSRPRLGRGARQVSVQTWVRGGPVQQAQVPVPPGRGPGPRVQQEVGVGQLDALAPMFPCDGHSPSAHARAPSPTRPITVVEIRCI